MPSRRPRLLLLRGSYDHQVPSRAATTMRLVVGVERLAARVVVAREAGHVVGGVIGHAHDAGLEVRVGERLAARRLRRRGRLGDGRRQHRLPVGGIERRARRRGGPPGSVDDSRRAAARRQRWPCRRASWPRWLRDGFVDAQPLGATGTPSLPASWRRGQACRRPTRGCSAPTGTLARGPSGAPSGCARASVDDKAVAYCSAPTGRRPLAGVPVGAERLRVGRRQSRRAAARRQLARRREARSPVGAERLRDGFVVDRRARAARTRRPRRQT